MPLKIKDFADTPEVIQNLDANLLYWKECVEREQLQILQQKMQVQLETTNCNHTKILEDTENEAENVTFFNQE